ncbi:hypothetical protein CBR_g25988 [Chara braunii]|uniref:Uncharacterized protein n=1 Tax=Chara braunii TaxID=69332 RepID=A0A388L737_CHABU|nr:hypothetical protein CBR_g25988 [Chara braunii]|eukprot:GBG78052.1 hypothetical protein CBR_g25988 [Chara braunii]
MADKNKKSKRGNQSKTTTSKKAKRSDSLTIRELQAIGEGDSARLGIAAAREPSEKSKRKLAAEEGDGQKKPRRRKTAEGTSGDKTAVGRQYDEATTFWLEYKRNDDGEIVEKELPIQLLIDPGKSVTHKPERAQRVHKDVFKPEDKDKYFNYPVNGQHTVAAVKELAGKPIFELWKMHSWPARVVWFSDEDFGGYLQVSLTENTRHKMSKQHAQKAAFEDMREAWENKGRTVTIQGNPSRKEAEKQAFFDFQKLLLGKSPNDAHLTMTRKATTLADKDHVAAIGNASRQWMSLLTASDEVFRKSMEFYDKWAGGKLLGGDGKTPCRSRANSCQTNLWLSKRFRKWARKGRLSLANMPDAEKLSILDDILALRGVFVKSAGGHLKRQHKPEIKDMVATRTVDRMMLRMFHYILFLESEEDAEVWRYGSQFFRTEEQLLVEFVSRGLTKQVWVELRKHFHDAVEYVNTCKRCLQYEKKSLDETKEMYDDERFPKSFEKSVRSILRRTVEEVQDTIRVSGDVRHIKWHKINRVTSLIPFSYPASQAHNRLTEIREIVRHYRNLVFGLLNGYHNAPRESVSNFLKRLNHVFFLMAKPLTLKNYKAQFDEEDPFDAEDMEEMSDSETFDFESMPLPRVVAQVDDEGEGVPRRYSTSPAGLKRVFERETVEDQSCDDGEEERDYDYEPGDKLPRDHDTWENARLFFYGRHHRFTPEAVWGHNVWHPRKFQPAVKTGKWVMAMKEADGKWSGMNRLGAVPFKKKAKETLVEHLSVMNPDRSLPDVNAYAGQKLDELYDNKILEFRAPFYTLETAPSRGIDWRMPQPPSGGQHPGGSGRGDGGDDAGPGGGGDEGDGSGSGGDEAKGKRPCETLSEPIGFDGKRSGEKGSGGKESGGKGSGRKGPGGKRRAFRSHESIGTESRCKGSRYSDMRDEASLRSYSLRPYQVRVHSHLSPRTLFHFAGERKMLEGPAAGVLETGPSEYERYASEGASIDLKSKSAADPGEEGLSQDAHAVHREEETQHWPPNRVLDGLDAGVLETGASGHLRRPSEGASIELESKSTPPSREGELSQEAHVVQQEEETQHWPFHKVREGLDEGVFETSASEHQCHASEGASVDVESKSATTLGEEDLSQEAHAVQRDVGSDGGESHCEGSRDSNKRDEAAPGSYQATCMDVWGSSACGDEEAEEEPVVETRFHDDEEGELFGAGGEVSARLHDDEAGEETVGEAQLYAGEVSARPHVGEVSARQMGSKRTDHDSPSTNCGEEQGDRASALSSGWEMVLHEAANLVSAAAAIELVSDSAVVEMQNIESSADVGRVARQEAGSPRRTPEHGVRLSMSLPMKPS